MIFSLQPPWLKMICFVAIYTTSYLLNGDASRAYRIDGDLFIRSSPPITYQNGYRNQTLNTWKSQNQPPSLVSQIQFINSGPQTTFAASVHYI